MPELAWVAVGALAMRLLGDGVTMWLSRNHKLDLTGVRIVATKPRDPKQEKPEDFFEMAKERGDAER